MIAAWMVYCLAISLVLGLAALALEHTLRLRALPVRWVWMASLAGSLIVPAAVWLSPPPAALPGPSVEGQLAPLGGETASALPRPSPGVLAESPAFLSTFDLPLLVLWALSSVVLLLFLAASQLRLLRRRRRWRRVVVDGVPALVAPATGPAVVGVFRGAIVLPEWALGMEKGLRQLMLTHEEEHLRARDPLLLSAALAMLVPMPWNAALWWQLRRLRLAVEVDCDARVLRRGSDVRAYGNLLLEVGQCAAAGRWAVAAFSQSPSLLERRIRIMTTPRPRTAGVAALLLAGVAALLVAVAWRAPSPAQAAPDTAAAATAADTLPLVTLRIEPGGRYYLDADAEPVPVEQLAERLRERVAAHPGAGVLRVFMHTQAGGGYDLALAANAAREAGFERMRAAFEWEQDLTRLPEGPMVPDTPAVRPPPRPAPLPRAAPAAPPAP